MTVPSQNIWKCIEKTENWLLSKNKKEGKYPAECLEATKASFSIVIYVQPVRIQPYEIQ